MCVRRLTVRWSVFGGAAWQLWRNVSLVGFVAVAAVFYKTFSHEHKHGKPFRESGAPSSQIRTRADFPWGENNLLRKFEKH